MAVGDIYKLRLESIAAGGDALGRFDGKPVFVEAGAPDEAVVCRVTMENKSYRKAELLEIIEPSALRVNSPCVFYGKCGGCNLAHINYEAQLAIKASILKETLVKIGGLQPPEPEIFASPPWEYRNRMQFHCIRQSQKFGLKERASARIIPVTDCPVAATGIRELLRSGELPLPPEKDRFTVFSKDTILLSESGQKRGKIKLLDKEISLDAGLFFQSNCFMLEKLILELRKIAEDTDKSLPMADLYCGVGTFAVFLCDLFPKIILAEENKTAISIARENLKGINAEFFALRDTDWPRVLNKMDFGFAVVDPPRTGLSLKLDGPAVLAYVSCDAASLARDAKSLLESGYKLKKIMLFDFYPQTAHIESLAVFEK
ncbi:MAG: methyltransferase [Treponema sp.]|nr:methyltransferase [Treponema sp.]